MEPLADLFHPVEPLLALLTQLGDVWFLTMVALVAYWFPDRLPLADWDRRQGLRLVAVALLAFATTHLLKAAFGLPRPVGAGRAAFSLPGPLGPLYGAAATGTGHAFPSGHAVGTAAVYGVVALSARGTWRARRRWVALGLVALVSFTRLALGVHYLGDVVVGAAVGFVLAALVIGLDARPWHVFVAAGFGTAASVLVAPLFVETAALLGATVGALAAGWGLAVGGQPAEREPTREVVAVWIVGAASLLAAPALAWVGWLTPSVGAAALGGSLLAIGLPATPWAGEKRR